MSKFVSDNKFYQVCDKAILFGRFPHSLKSNLVFIESNAIMGGGWFKIDQAPSDQPDDLVAHYYCCVHNLLEEDLTLLRLLGADLKYVGRTEIKTATNGDVLIRPLRNVSYR